MKRYHAQVSISFWAENKQEAIEHLKDSLQNIMVDDEELEMMISEETMEDKK